MIKRKVYGARRLASRLKRGPDRPHTPPAELETGDAATRLAILQGVSVFFTQPKPLTRSLARAARQLSVTKGEVLVREGQANQNLFVIVNGQFAVSIGSGGDTVPIALLGPLDIFGVDSVVSGAPAAATVTGTTDGEVLVLSRQHVMSDSGERSGIATQLTRVAAQRTGLVDAVSRRTRVPKGMGSVIAVYSPKGGAGKTTVALNLSAALAASHPAEVVLLDLGLPYNDAALLSGHVPTTCLARLVTDMDGAFDELMLSSALHHASEFMILPTALTPEEADLITQAVVIKALETLRKEFKYVVVDCCVQLSEPVLAVLERAQHVVVITTPRLASLKDMPHLIELLEDVLHVPTGRIHVTINHTGPKAALTRDDIEKMTGRRAAAEFGYDSAAERAAIEGELLWKLKPAGPVANGAAQLSARLNGRPGAANRRLDLARVASRLEILRRRGIA